MTLTFLFYFMVLNEAPSRTIWFCFTFLEVSNRFNPNMATSQLADVSILL
jgi:hypothetical protein